MSIVLSIHAHAHTHTQKHIRKKIQCPYPGKVHAKFKLRDEMENYTTLILHDS